MKKRLLTHATFKGEKNMLTGFLRTIVLFFVTAVVLRLMGKRQLAQLQPYEVVITLMISDLATLPMADVEIPLLNGVVSILTLLLVHSLLSALSYASLRMRRIICGRPSVLVRDGKICEKERFEALLSLERVDMYCIQTSRQFSNGTQPETKCPLS